MAHCLGIRPWPQFWCRGWDCGPGRRSRGHVLRFLVISPGPGSCILAWPQVLCPRGLSSLRRNAVLGQGGRQGQGRGLQLTPTPTTLGTVWQPTARLWEWSLQTILSPKDPDTLVWICHCGWRVAGSWSQESMFWWLSHGDFREGPTHSRHSVDFLSFVPTQLPMLASPVFLLLLLPLCLCLPQTGSHQISRVTDSRLPV